VDEERMYGYIEITSCRAGFRVSRVDEHFAMFEHRDFSTLDDAQRFAEALVVRDPTLGLVDRTEIHLACLDESIAASDREPAPLTPVTADCAGDLSHAAHA
jgi:hypothetical protein